MRRDCAAEPLFHSRDFGVLEASFRKVKVQVALGEATQPRGHSGITAANACEHFGLGLRHQSAIAGSATVSLPISDHKSLDRHKLITLGQTHVQLPILH